MMPTTLNIVRADWLGDYRIGLDFDDGVHRIVDFRSFLMHSQHPAIRAFLDPQQFSAFRVEYGELLWGDYDLCFPIADLYNNALAPVLLLDEAA